MSEFKTTMQAEIRVPQAGFTLDDLKSHMRSAKVPLDARLKPAVVRDAYPDERDPNEGSTEVAFIAEWVW